MITPMKPPSPSSCGGCVGKLWLEDRHYHSHYNTGSTSSLITCPKPYIQAELCNTAPYREEVVEEEEEEAFRVCKIIVGTTVRKSKAYQELSTRFHSKTWDSNGIYFSGCCIVQSTVVLTSYRFRNTHTKSKILTW